MYLFISTQGTPLYVNYIEIQLDLLQLWCPCAVMTYCMTKCHDVGTDDIHIVLYRKDTDYYTTYTIIAFHYIVGDILDTSDSLSLNHTLW